MPFRPARALFRDERGATSIEYALIAGMVAFIVIAGLTAFATSVSDLWSSVAQTINASVS